MTTTAAGRLGKHYRYPIGPGGRLQAKRSPTCLHGISPAFPWVFEHGFSRTASSSGRMAPLVALASHHMFADRSRTECGHQRSFDLVHRIGSPRKGRSGRLWAPSATDPSMNWMPSIVDVGLSSLRYRYGYQWVDCYVVVTFAIRVHHGTSYPGKSRENGYSHDTLR